VTQAFTDYYVDSSVILRALLGDSAAALQWFNSLSPNHDRLVCSRIGELEVRRVATNAGVVTRDIDAYLNAIAFYALDDKLIDEALAIPQRLGAADALHLATASRLGKQLTIVTHDRQMAVAAKSLGFAVHDPVTDDPGRAPVA